MRIVTVLYICLIFYIFKTSNGKKTSGKVSVSTTGENSEKSNGASASGSAGVNENGVHAEGNVEKNLFNSVALRLQKVESLDNNYIVAEKASRGYNLVIKDDLSKQFFNMYFVGFIYTKESLEEEPKKSGLLYAARICDMMKNIDNDDKQLPPKFFPHKVIDLLFPPFNEDCSLKKQKNPIKSFSLLSRSARDNPGIKFPKSFKYYTQINIIPYINISSPENGWIVSATYETYNI